MKAMKIDLTEYHVESQVADEKGKVKTVKRPYDVKEAIANIICHPSLKNDGFRQYTISKVADKIASHKSGSITLDAKDYDIVKVAFDSFKGWSRNDTELLARIYEAEEVEMKESKKKK